jgi:hypothetical protein
VREKLTLLLRAEIRSVSVQQHLALAMSISEIVEGCSSRRSTADCANSSVIRTVKFCESFANRTAKLESEVNGGRISGTVTRS